MLSINKNKKNSLTPRKNASPWLTDNPYILTGYIQNIKTPQQALHSLFYLHNESLNIWTHLLGLLSFTYLLTTKSLQNQKTGLKTDFYPIAVYLITVITCLSLSTIYHTFKPVSLKTQKVLQRLDMAGISILIFGSTFAADCYFFYCEISLWWIYVSLSFFSCFAVFVVMLFEKMHSPEMNHVKGLSYGVLGVVNGMGILQWMYLSIFADQRNSFLPFNKGYFGTVFMGVLYLTGLTFYIKKFPEKYYPGRFDFFGQSHSIFHVFVLLAALEYYFTVDYFRGLREEVGCYGV